MTHYRASGSRVSVSSCILISAAHFIILAVVYVGLLPQTGRDWADVVSVSLRVKGTDAEALGWRILPPLLKDFVS